MNGEKVNAETDKARLKTNKKVPPMMVIENESR